MLAAVLSMARRPISKADVISTPTEREALMQAIVPPSIRLAASAIATSAMSRSRNDIGALYRKSLSDRVSDPKAISTGVPPKGEFFPAISGSFPGKIGKPAHRGSLLLGPLILPDVETI